MLIAVKESVFCSLRNKKKSWYNFHFVVGKTLNPAEMCDHCSVFIYTVLRFDGCRQIEHLRFKPQWESFPFQRSSELSRLHAFNKYSQKTNTVGITSHCLRNLHKVTPVSPSHARWCWMRNNETSYTFIFVKSNILKLHYITVHLPEIWNQKTSNQSDIDV